MTDAPKQYRYKHLFSLGGFDAGKTMCCLKQSDSEPFIISNEEFERNFEPVPVWEMSAGGGHGLMYQLPSPLMNGESIPVEQAAQGWISLRDKVPEDGVDVLFYHMDGYQLTGSVWGGIMICAWSHTPLSGSITHFMTLPKPPAIEGDGV